MSLDTRFIISFDSSTLDHIFFPEVCSLKNLIAGCHKGYWHAATMIRLSLFNNVFFKNKRRRPKEIPNWTDNK